VSYVGVCRKWSDSNTTCDRAFPPNLDVSMVILKDLRLTSNVSLLADTASGTHESFPTLSKAAVALIITSLIWSLLVFGLVQVMPTEFYVQILPLLVNLSLSISAWVIYNYVFYEQFNSPANPPVVTGGAGFWVFLVYLLCTLLITPVTTFWVLVTCLSLIIGFLILVWICIICFMAMVACMLGGGEEEGEGMG
jgi:hypothetical protein